MNQPQPGCRVFITGGGAGIGRATADAFAACGARLCILDRDAVNDAPADWLLRRGSAASGDDIEAALAAMDSAWGGVDVAFANAGMSMNKPTLELTEAEWRAAMELNLTGVFLTAQAAGRRMVAAGSGLILMTSSIYGLVGAPVRAAYTSTKAAVANLTRSLADEWGPHGVRVNALAPGYTETAMVRELVEDGRLDVTALVGRAPLRRLVQPREVAAAACFLASPAASAITGVVLPVDAGWTANGAP